MPPLKSTLHLVGLWVNNAFLVIILLLIAYEYLWNKQHKAQVYDPKETLTNLSFPFVYIFSKGLIFNWYFFILEPLYAFNFQPIEMNISGILLMIFFTDFAYYWAHRCMHTIKLFWALHVTHHTVKYFNFSATFRMNFIDAFVVILFYAPLALLGFPPVGIIFSIAFIHMYQFWCHTESIGKVSLLEGIINTPSAHRVHHGSNNIYLDKNFGGILMLWDRLFGTYVEEKENPIYGITSEYFSYNPAKLSLHGLYDYIRGKMNYRG